MGLGWQCQHFKVPAALRGANPTADRLARNRWVGQRWASALYQDGVSGVFTKSAPSPLTSPGMEEGMAVPFVH